MAVVERYYAAIQARDYRAAHAIWNGGRSLAAFRRGYAATDRVSVTPLPPFESDAGAGSVFARINVRVDTVLRDGTRQRFVGAYHLRRVNDVDGSSAAQRSWHIEAARLRLAR